MSEINSKRFCASKSEVSELPVALGVRDLLYGHDGLALFDPLTFSIPRAQVCAILGPNGTGKTTLLETLMGMRTAIAGEVFSARRPGFVSQYVSNDIALSVRDVVLLGRANHVGLFGQPTAHDEALVREWLAALGIIDFIDRDYRSLSGGERQLVMIARSLVSECEVLLLDEPMSALDIRRQKTLLKLIATLSSHRNMSILFSTHEPQHAWVLADWVLLLGPGKTVTFGPTKVVMTPDRLSELYQTPVHCLNDQESGEHYFVTDFSV